jgi:hypothetical protein
VDTYEFPLAEGLPHDLIDPANPDLDSKKVYPVVIEAILGE